MVVMTNVILPFLMSMMLGRTIDLTTYTISGANVYDDADYDEIPALALNTTYNVFQEDAHPYNFFGIPIDIALRIKFNFLNAASGPMGLEGMLKDTSWKYNSAIVSVATLYRTVDRSLKENATVIANWTDKVSQSQTHYAETLYYGGWSLVLFRFQCDIASDVPLVRNVLTRNLGVVGTFSADSINLWNEAIKEIQRDDDIRGTVTLHTHIYSTMPIGDTISSPEDLIKMIKGIPETVGPLGQPLFMNLLPLHALDPEYPEATENIELLTELEKLDQMVDDVKLTKVNMMRWISETQTAFEDDQEERISNLLKIIDDCVRAFSKLGAEVSLFKPTNRNNLDSAYQKYLGGLEKGIGTYNLAYRRLKEEIDAQCENAFLHKIKGLLRVFDSDAEKKGEVEGGLKECRALCLANQRCRAIGYGDHISELDVSTGLYLRREKQCWIYFRSTSTASVHSPNGLSGDMGVYDRHCY